MCEAAQLPETAESPCSPKKRTPAQAKYPGSYANARDPATLVGHTSPYTPQQGSQPMQQPLEERVASLETAAERHEQTLARLDTIVENHDELLERLQTNQETLQANQEALHANQEKVVSLLEELTRDAATTRRLWLRLAQRYGWLDDEQNGAQPDTTA